MDRASLFPQISDKEEKMFFSSIYDKIQSAHRRGCPSFSDFCTLSQIESIKSLFMKDYPDVGFVSQIINSERKIPAINFSYSELPTDIIYVGGVSSLDVSHRDILGALMNLGIKRQKIGDIIVGDRIFFEVKEEITEYVILNLTKIKNRNIKCEIFSGEVEHIYHFEELFLTVSSLRADCIVSGILNLSRENGKEYILSGGMLVNSKEFLNPSGNIAVDSVISLRGNGKYLFSEILGTTKKDRLKIVIKKYI